MVIGNDLHTRKWEVVFVSQTHGTPTELDSKEGFNASWLRIDPALTTPGAGAGAGGREVKEIEEDIVKELKERHAKWIARG